MPIIKEHDLKIKEEDLLNAELENIKKLDVENLSQVGGGVSLKPFLLSGGILATVMFGASMGALQTSASGHQTPIPTRQESSNSVSPFAMSGNDFAKSEDKKKTKSTPVDKEENKMEMVEETKKEKENKQDGKQMSTFNVDDFKKPTDEKENKMEIKQETKKEKEVTPLDHKSMKVISKYFKTINDYINIEKTHKDYRGIVEQYHYNPISFNKKLTEKEFEDKLKTKEIKDRLSQLIKEGWSEEDAKIKLKQELEKEINKKSRELFKNIENYHFYNKKDKEKYTTIIKKADDKIKKEVHWEPVSYNDYLENKNENKEYKTVKGIFYDEYSKLKDEDENKANIIKSDPNIKIIVPYDKYLELDEDEKNNLNIELTVNYTKYLELKDNETFKNIPYKKIILTKYDISNKRYYNRPIKVDGNGKVIIPKEVTNIDNHCFKTKENLKEIEFEKGSNLQTIGYGAFSYTSIEKIMIPKTVEIIRDFCFEDCKALKEVKFEDDSNLQTIGNSAFAGTLIEEITIPVSVETIGGYCFVSCKN